MLKHTIYFGERVLHSVKVYLSIYYICFIQPVIVVRLVFIYIAIILKKSFTCVTFFQFEVRVNVNFSGLRSQKCSNLNLRLYLYNSFYFQYFCLFDRTHFPGTISLIFTINNYFNKIAKNSLFLLFFLVLTRKKI